MKSKRKLVFTTILILSMVVSAGIAFASSTDGEESTLSQLRLGWKMGFGRDNIKDGKYASTVTEADLVNIEGTVSEINTLTQPFSMKVRTDEKTVDVNLGRAVFLDEFKALELKENSPISLIGINRTFTVDNEDVNIFVPFTITSNDNEVNLRDENNRPLWSGEKRGKGMMGQGRGQRGNGNFQNNDACPYFQGQ